LEENPKQSHKLSSFIDFILIEVLPARPTNAAPSCNYELWATHQAIWVYT